MTKISETLGITLPRGHSHGRDDALVAYEIAEYEAATCVLVPSDYVAHTFRERGVPENRLARHRYGCDLAQFEPPADDRRSDDGGAVFAYVGSIEPRKGLHLLGEAWPEAVAGTSARLVIAGRLMAEYEPHVRSLLRHERVTHLDFTDEVPKLLQSADVLVLPSLEEGSALVTYEGQAAGCALIVSDAAGALLEPGVHGLVHPAGDIVSLRTDLRRLATNPEALRAMQHSATADRQRLSWSVAARVLETRYHEAISGLIERDAVRRCGGSVGGV